MQEHLDKARAANKARRSAEARLIENVLAAREEGASLRQIAKHVGISHMTVQAIIRKAEAEASNAR